ncbi:hypothetical protein SAY86_003679 [Trapa natans]|uniref:Galactose oxidase n=1 Tax=Trapa natans TaxID=22666 RepID=A0AAN7MEL7_TRANT|nr:hypothetical protein SAY86_003679 [Trapa natans]
MNSTGVVPMHMALTHLNTVVMFDQTGFGPSRYRLRRRFRGGKKCKAEGDDLTDGSCYAHSIEYDITTNSIRALRLRTDPWCSSGSFLSNGTLIQVGGYRDGSRRIRYFQPCHHRAHCNWKQSKSSLSAQRWYATTQILPEADRAIIVGGRRAFSYEYVPKVSSRDRSHDLPFLHNTHHRENDENNLYPFLHLSSDGNLFIFANRDSILFNYRRNRVVKRFPRIPGRGARNYPSSGSSVMLPLDYEDGFRKVEVMVCGGSAPGAYEAASQGRFFKGLRTCGRMVITGKRHHWKMEKMPKPRLMCDMLILPTSQILIINGAHRGSAGWNRAADPALQPYLYRPTKAPRKRFSVLTSTRIPLMYHSTAILLPNGRVLVGGSNPNHDYTFGNVAYPTELRLQEFMPHYMDRHYHKFRASNVTVHHGGGSGIRHGEEFTVRFWLGRRSKVGVEFMAYAPPFTTTHSVSMNQRMLRLRGKGMVKEVGGWVRVTVEAPQSSNVAPPGYYMLTVVNRGVPSFSHWIRFINA